jgi:hypothetical protein
MSVALLGVIALAAAGCQVAGFAAAAIHRNTPKKVPAAYAGLDGKSFAVVVNVERAVQAEYPSLAARLTTGISEDLKTSTKASAYTPPDLLLARLYEDPRWTVKPPADIARDLGVDRLVYVEVYEFRLNDPGNRYLWAGVAGGRVSVIEADSPLADDPVFDKPVQVTFPDNAGYTEQELSGAVVATELSGRFMRRVAWYFYDHKEARDLKY